MTESYRVRQYHEGDEAAITELLALVFNDWPRIDMECTPIKHWRWKHLDNPLEKSIVYVSEKDGNLIGCSHRVPIKIKIGPDVCLCYTGADLAVHPEYRGMGISKKFIELSTKSEREKGAELVYFITGNPIMIKSYIGVYPLFPHSIINLVRISDIGAHLRAMPTENPSLMKLGYNVAKLVNNVKNAFESWKSSSHSLNISQIDRFDGRIDIFWKEVSSHYNFMIERTESYLNWRYCDPRAGGFVVKQAEADGRILGYSVLKINRYQRRYPVGYVVDLLALPRRPEVVKALAEDAVDFFDGQNVNIINYQVVEGHPSEKVFDSLGFLNSRIKIHLFLHPLGAKGGLGGLKNGSGGDLHIAWGDHDVLPDTLPNRR